MTEDVGRKLVGSWYPRLKETLNSPEFEALGKFLSAERMKYDVYPKKEDVFKAFQLTPFNSVKIIVLSQDPYYTPGVATGLAFACPNNQLIPQPSLKQILLEVELDCYGGFNFENYYNFNLEHWAEQGVLLLNTALTVRKGESESHLKQWQFFTKEVIHQLNVGHTGLIWMLWGAKAQSFEKQINAKNHHILKAGHPAAFVYGKDTFSGCKHFSQANKILTDMNGADSQIKW